MIELFLGAAAVILLSYFCGRVYGWSTSISLEEKAVFITGCDSGFGFALAKKLDALGCNVYAGCLSPEKEGAHTLQRETSKRLRIVSLDVASDDSVQRAKETVVKDIGTRDLWAVVNNAGIMFREFIEICPIEVFRKSIEINLFGTIRVTKAFLPLIRKSKGRVVNITSIRGRFSSPTYCSYSISKYGVECFSDTLRMETREFGVNVSIIEPCRFATATSILKGGAYEERLKSLDDMWKASTPEVRATYDEGFQSLRKTVSSVPDSSVTPTISVRPVIDAIIDALQSVRPRKRYMVKGYMWDYHKLLASMLPFVPTDWMDNLIIWVTNK